MSVSSEIKAVKNADEKVDQNNNEQCKGDEAEEGVEATKRTSLALAEEAPVVPITEQPEAPITLSKFDQVMLNAHNAYREHHGTPPLIYSANIAQRAQYWANVLAKENCIYHERQSWDGENLAMKWASWGLNFPATDFVNMWYYEGYYYRYPGTELGTQKNARNQVTGHFSQLIWKNSKHVGFGRAVSKTGRVIVVARYRPPGNVCGWYNANVPPPKDGKLRRRY